MIDLTGFTGYKLAGKVIVQTNSQRMLIVNKDKETGCEIATFTSTKNRSFLLEGTFYLYVLDGSTFEQVDLNEIDVKQFKVIQD